MSSWLIDDPSTLLLILGVLALALIAGWWATRDRRYGYGLAGAACLVVVILLIGRWVETDAKRIRATLDEMSAAVKARSADQIFANLSDDFRLGSLSKSMFRPIVDGYLRSGQITGMNVSGFEVSELSREKRRAVVIFHVKGEGSANFGYDYFYCKAIFVLEPDSHWRMQTFQLFPPHMDPNTGEPLRLPFGM